MKLSHGLNPARYEKENRHTVKTVAQGNDLSLAVELQSKLKYQGVSLSSS